MNKRYMDFVPSKSTPVSRQQKVATRKQTVRMASTPRTVVKTSTGVNFDTRHNTTRSTRREPEMELGVIEDFAPKFIKTTTEKRPLNSGKTAPRRVANNVSQSAKVQKASAKVSGGIAKTGSAVRTRQVAKTNANYETPRTPFINMDKVVKRPLSKNVAQKNEKKILKKDAKKPVVAAKKKEKDSKVGLIITIILTIILGAAAGTVAFLLLPK